MAVMRHSMGGTKGTLMATGVVLGLGLAAGTVWLATLRSDHPTALADVLAVVFALWTLGWVLGPLSGGGAPVLRASHFALLPISRLRLAVGLLGASFVAVTTAITLLAFAGLAVYAARLGVGPTVVALPAVALQLSFAILLSRVAVALFGEVAKSRLGGALAGVTQGALMVVAQSGWMVIVAVDQFRLLRTGFPPEVVPAGVGVPDDPVVPVELALSFRGPNLVLDYHRQLVVLVRKKHVYEVVLPAHERVAKIHAIEVLPHPPEAPEQRREYPLATSVQGFSQHFSDEPLPENAGSPGVEQGGQEVGVHHFVFVETGDGLEDVETVE